jgi:hypothetical protein
MTGISPITFVISSPRSAACSTAVVELVEGGDDVIPCEKNVEAFIQWVHERDLYQVPDTATDFLRDQEALIGDKGRIARSMTISPCFQRKLVLQLRANANVSLGQRLPGLSGIFCAQVRERLGLGLVNAMIEFSDVQAISCVATACLACGT